MEDEYIQMGTAGIQDEETFLALRAAVNKTALIPAKNRISAKMAGRIKNLALDSRKYEVESLGFLDFFPNLVDLAVISGRLREVGPLSGLGKLEALYLENADIASLAPLAGCVKLKRLILKNLHVANNDFSPLGEVAALEYLTVNGGGLMEISWRPPS